KQGGLGSLIGGIGNRHLAAGKIGCSCGLGLPCGRLSERCFCLLHLRRGITRTLLRQRSNTTSICSIRELAPDRRGDRATNRGQAESSKASRANASDKSYSPCQLLEVVRHQLDGGRRDVVEQPAADVRAQLEPRGGEVVQLGVEAIG